MKGNWHELSVQAVMRILEADDKFGLSEDQVRRRREQFGENCLKEGNGVSPLYILFSQFRDFTVLVLLVATLFSGLLGQYDEAMTIIAIVVLNAVLGFVQEYRAETALRALKKLATTYIKVIRNGRELLVDSTLLVPGDLIILAAGDRIPADARIIHCRNLEVEESILTGESVPVRKQAQVVDKGAVIQERTNMVFMGTLCTRGKALAVVTGTGVDTEMGRIAELIDKTDQPPTPLQEHLYQLGQVLVSVCLALCALMAVLGVLRGEPIHKMFIAGVSLAVAAIPEGLPAIVTVALAIGVQRMIRRNAIVRKLPSVETLGCTTVICSDKTGTLTKNEMTVREVRLAREVYEVTGSGYLPQGDILRDGKSIKPRNGSDLSLALSIACLCNDARLVEIRDGPYLDNEALTDKSGWEVHGEPTEGALLVLAAKAGIWREVVDEQHPRVYEIPFESQRKCMTVVCENNSGYTAYCKGAPEVILERATRFLEQGTPRPLTGKVRNEILEASREMGERALRVLALAYRPLAEKQHFFVDDELENGLIFVGLVGMIDPPRPEVYEALEKCRYAGIRTIMITGDQISTAVAIAAELNIVAKPRRGVPQAVSGAELDGLNEKHLREAAASVNVFARVSPEHKLRLVRTLKKLGNVVAMTGDGVNDAPALKSADIGVAMGQKGTEVSKEAASLVLADDNFATIVAAVEEGRNIYSNIRKFIRYLLACNIGELLTMFLAILLGLPIPLKPIQILWVNLVTDGLPAMALGIDPGDHRIMLRPPRKPNEGIFAGAMGIQIVRNGILIGVSTLLIFTFGLYLYGGDLLLARTLAFCTLVTAQLIHVFNCRWDESGRARGLAPNYALLAAVLSSFLLMVAVIYIPFLQPIFAVTPLTLGEWLTVLVFALIPLVLTRGMAVAAGERELISSKRSS